ncbi:carbohydrate ABC transporter permease [uncultured Amnibacterium sp.]|uniref:carbohydrate ABC transporter permease n=1 Tax=uncultured Amnibacterium sp. TaxID=1631851 RepID=UPI0035CC7356
MSRALLWPALGVTIALTQLPFISTIIFSFQNWNLLRPADRGFAGLGNYAEVLTDADFYGSVVSTVVITGGSVILSLAIGLFIALLLNRPFPGQWLARTLLITPFLVMPAAAALIWKWSILDANFGVLNWAISAVGLPQVAWNTDYPVVTIVMVLTWQYTPFMMLILLAGLQSQSPDILEAASVDGAGRVRIFRSLTLPHLRQYIELAALLGSITLLQVFDPVTIMTGGSGGTTTLSYLLYEKAFIGLDIGVASAYGVVTVIITIAVATVALRLLFKIFSTDGLK